MTELSPIHLDEIEAQLDSTVPYYVPSLIAEIRRLRRIATLVQYWRTVGKRLQKQTDYQVAGDQLLECADELEAALTG